VRTSKFAAVTASLLARKGDAAPSDILPMLTPSRRAPDSSDDRPPSELPLPFFEGRRLDDTVKMRRVVISLMPEELERLGIAAIKKGVSRHDIIRDALDGYFRKLSSELSKPCACMAGTSCCSGAAE
jgi:hypothetical protein